MRGSGDACGGEASSSAGGGGSTFGHQGALDGLRAVAVVLVMLLHGGAALWPAASGWLARGGSLGVHLFFVLSGFLITTLLLLERQRTGRVDLAAFARRRTRRLLPVAVALVLVLCVAASGERIGARSAVSTGVHVLTFTSNWAYAAQPLPLAQWLTGTSTLLLDARHTWSLAIEVQFYVLWGLGVWAAVRAGWTPRRLFVATGAVVVLVAAARALAYASGTSWITLYLVTWSRIDALLVGALVGIAFSAGRLARPPRWLVPAGGVALALYLVFAFTVEGSAGAWPLGLYTALAVVAAVTIAAVVWAPSSALSRLLAWRPLATVGVLSYSLYMWHLPLFVEMHRWHLPGPVALAGGFALAMVVSWLSYQLIEQPFRHRASVGEVQLKPSS